MNVDLLARGAVFSDLKSNANAERCDVDRVQYLNYMYS